MAEDLFVDVRYRGLELARRSRIEDFAAASAYLHHPTPMPVGSSLLLQAEDSLEIPVRVTRVSEQVAGTERPPGMFIEPEDLSGKGEDWWKARVAGESTESPAAVVEEPPRDTEEMPAQEAQPEATPEPEAKQAEPEPEAKPKKRKRRRKKSK
jgi:hypothetical protein